MARCKPIRLAGMIAVLSASVPAMAAGTGGCESFDFPLATELRWMKATDTATAQSGARLDAPPARAIALTLQPTAAMRFEVPPTGKARNTLETSFAAVLHFAAAPAPGIYQVSLSGPGWVDVVQDGVALKSGAHTGKSDCEGLRKSVRFEVKDGPFSVQLSDVPTNSIKVIVRPASAP